MSEAEVRAALDSVNDPHVPVSLARMKMLRGVTVSSEGVVNVGLGIPCLSCPGVSMLKEQITKAVTALEGVSEVCVHEGWHHEWTSDMLDEETRGYMRRYGIQA